MLHWLHQWTSVTPSKISQDLSHLFLIHAIQGCGTLLPKFVETFTWHHLSLLHALWGGYRAEDMRMESLWMFNAPLVSSVNGKSNYSLRKIAQWSRIFANRFPTSMRMFDVTLKLFQFRLNVSDHIFDFFFLFIIGFLSINIFFSFFIWH